MKAFASSWKTNALAAACAVLATLSGAASAANNWNPQHILSAFKNPYHTITSPSNTTIVGTIAHRGVVSSGCPENSSCSILATYNANVEAIELDVKQSDTGQPWLFHDQNVGRLIDHSPAFNIFQDATNPAGWNPDVRSLDDQALTSTYFLRDKNFNRTGYHPVSLSRALDLIKSSANHMVVVLDIKTLDAVSRAADMAKARGMQNQVVLKFSASLLPNNPGSIVNYTKGVAFVPTIYAGDMDKIVDSGYVGSCSKLLGSYLCRVESWITDATKVSNYAWVEIGNKAAQPGDPTYQLVSTLKGQKAAMGAFTPVKEYRLNASDGAHYVRSNGTCCAKLSDYLTKTKHFGNETVDLRERIDPQLSNGFTTIISDDAAAVNTETSSFGLRHTAFYN
ncbi:glycerophosphodiester phosphodiesterase family protein [Xanthomonas bundabergensis]|uniref:glycerophosphodiester phosphodiesterase family protein n=1 Tax=Xanthomonas bundabergensis TaxID=3160842 RepID=UPI003510F8DB